MMLKSDVIFCRHRGIELPSVGGAARVMWRVVVRYLGNQQVVDVVEGTDDSCPPTASAFSHKRTRMHTHTVEGSRCSLGVNCAVVSRCYLLHIHSLLL